jgi:multidrug transporter EmrE-like cation transporter
MGMLAGEARGAVLTWQLIANVLVSVSCSAFAQVALKHGMGIGSVQSALQSGEARQIVIAIISSPTVWLGLCFYGLSAVVWLFVLAKLDVSVAYTFVALGFLLTMALGCLLLGEPFSARKLAGTLFVMLGVWLVAG